MVHYVCSQCGMQSSQKGVCQTEGCINQSSALTECHCEDGRHDGIMNTNRDDESSPGVRSEQTLDLDGEIS